MSDGTFDGNYRNYGHWRCFNHHNRSAGHISGGFFGHNNGGERGREDDGLGMIKISIPLFTGRTDPEKYLEWVIRVDQIYDGQKISKEKKVCVSSMEFTEYTLD